MIVAIVIVLALVAAIGFFAWQYQIEQTAALAAQIRIAEIQAQARLDYLDHIWPFAVLLAIVGTIAILAVAYTIIVTKSPGPVITDNRTVILLGPGESKRQLYKAIGSIKQLPMAERIERLEKQPVKLLSKGEQ